MFIHIPAPLPEDFQRILGPGDVAGSVGRSVVRSENECPWLWAPHLIVVMVSRLLCEPAGQRPMAK